MEARGPRAGPDPLDKVEVEDPDDVDDVPLEKVLPEGRVPNPPLGVGDLDPAGMWSQVTIPVMEEVEVERARVGVLGLTAAPVTCT